MVVYSHVIAKSFERSVSTEATDIDADPLVFTIHAANGHHWPEDGEHEEWQQMTLRHGISFHRDDRGDREVNLWAGHRDNLKKAQIIATVEFHEGEWKPNLITAIKAAEAKRGVDHIGVALEDVNGDEWPPQAEEHNGSRDSTPRHATNFRNDEGNHDVAAPRDRIDADPVAILLEIAKAYQWPSIADEMDDWKDLSPNHSAHFWQEENEDKEGAYRRGVSLYPAGAKDAARPPKPVAGIEFVDGQWAPNIQTEIKAGQRRLAVLLAARAEAIKEFDAIVAKAEATLTKVNELTDKGVPFDIALAEALCGKPAEAKALQQAREKARRPDGAKPPAR